MEISEEIKANRTPDYPIHPLIFSRWSPRSMTGEELTDKELFSLFEAARWAPSSYNNQPWRFIYTKKGSSSWNSFLEFLIESNQAWASKASCLLVVISSKFFEHNQKPAQTHSFDTGAAWQNMALEGSRKGLVVHAMQGFDYKKAQSQLSIPDTFTVEAMIAIGKRAPSEQLPKNLQEKERPNQRKPISEIIMKDHFIGN